MDMRELHCLGLSQAGFHKIAYNDWGHPSNQRVLVCAHGLTRNARDFDDLASALYDQYRVICFDAAGRGRSDWLANKADYNYPQYAADANALIARTGAPVVDWLGTSMGGILGMILAAQPNSPIRRLVINDVGSLVPKASLERIGAYVGKSMAFENEAALVAAVKAASPFGPLTESQWTHVATSGARRLPDGRWQFSYDPAIAEVFSKAIAADVDLSFYWDKVTCPVLLTRGANSDLLLPETFQAMCARPNVTGVEFADVGHAPMFMDAGQIKVVRDFLLAA
ncbi:MAG: alpha/beta hydrolase [Betaproteobacteria bacterium]|nr:alpha/beta hydrolase [Betaproteobacteria bacterium]